MTVLTASLPGSVSPSHPPPPTPPSSNQEMSFSSAFLHFEEAQESHWWQLEALYIYPPPPLSFADIAHMAAHIDVALTMRQQNPHNDALAGSHAA